MKFITVQSWQIAQSLDPAVKLQGVDVGRRSVAARYRSADARYRSADALPR